MIMDGRVRSSVQPILSRMRVETGLALVIEYPKSKLKMENFYMFYAN